MPQLSFQYSDGPFTLKLIFGCLAIVFASLMLLLPLHETIPPFLSIVVGFGVAVYVFVKNRHKMTREGYAVINSDRVDFNLSGSTRTVLYQNVRSYQVERYNGTRLRIKFSDGTKLKLLANSIFCNHQAFDNFCAMLDNALKQFSESRPGAGTIREKSFFEKKWALPLLTFLTIGGIAFVTVAVVNGADLPLSATGFFAAMAGLWGGYLTTRKKT